jgi:hypothetical protein
MPSYEREVREVLREHGCYLHRQGRGDHEMWYSPLTNRKFTVDGVIKSRHTANAIMKQAGIKKKF